MKLKAKAIVDRLLETDFVGKPISGVRYNDRNFVFYPYAGPIEHKKGGQCGYIKTRAGEIHGRFFMRGQHFMFEPSDGADWMARPQPPKRTSDPLTFSDLTPDIRGAI